MIINATQSVQNAIYNNGAIRRVYTNMIAGLIINLQVKQTFRPLKLCKCFKLIFPIDIYIVCYNFHQNRRFAATVHRISMKISWF